MDARGVKTIYDYADDPVNRLQHVTYDLSGFGDKANPVMPSPPVTFRYMTTGDVTRVFQVVMQRENDDSWGLHEYGYDSEGRLASKALSYLGNPQLVSNYKYDNFDRLTQEIYPAEYGTAAATREQIDYIYGTGGVLSELMIDGVAYVSQVVYNPARQISRCGPKHTIMIRMATAPALRRQVKRRTAHPYPLDGLPALTYDTLTNHVTALTNLVTAQGFAYDAAGNQTRVVRADGSSLRYQYDAAGHLAVVFDGNDKVLEQYAYDADGRRLLKSGSDASIDPTYICPGSR